MSTAVRCRIGADVGGTFTDVILQDGDGRASSRSGCRRRRATTRPSSRRSARWQAGRGRRPRRRGRPRDDGRHQCSARAARKPNRPRHDRRFRDVRSCAAANATDVRPSEEAGATRPTWSSKSERLRTGRSHEACPGEVREIAGGSARPGRRRSRSPPALVSLPEHERNRRDPPRRIAACRGRSRATSCASRANTSGRRQLPSMRTCSPGRRLSRRHQTRPEARKIRAPVMIMQSSGGIMTAADARVRPVPPSSGAGGRVVAALAISRQLGWQNVISSTWAGRPQRRR
jgi:hypothetical protein